MKPIAIFQHSPNVDPGYFASFLNEQGMPFEHIRIDRGESVPASPAAFSGLCFMGGTMSVNDSLPWIPPVLALIRQAVDAGIPVIGHCLGGQLMAKALGGSVTRNAVPEIGWGSVSVADNPSASQWLGDIPGFDAFHWHGDTFSLPPNAIPLAASQHCPNQAFALGPHLGLQCHIEMTETLIHTWNREWNEQNLQHARFPASVQDSTQQLADTPCKLPPMRAIAHRLYSRWLDYVRQA